MATVEVGKEDTLTTYADEQYRKLKGKKINAYHLMNTAPNMTLNKASFKSVIACLPRPLEETMY